MDTHIHLICDNFHIDCTFFPAVKAVLLRSFELHKATEPFKMSNDHKVFFKVFRSTSLRDNL